MNGESKKEDLRVEVRVGGNVGGGGGGEMGPPRAVWPRDRSLITVT